MNISEYIAMITPKVVAVLGEPQPNSAYASIVANIDSILQSNEEGVDPVQEVPATVTTWVVPVIKLLPGSRVSAPSNHQFLVSNYGSVEENCMIMEQLPDPVDDTLIAVAYLEGLVSSGTWVKYVEHSSEPKRPDLDFFSVTAYVPEGGNVVKKDFLITYDTEGNPTHTEIV